MTPYFLEPSIWIWNGRAALAADVTGPTSESQVIVRLDTYDPTSRRSHLLPIPPDEPIAANLIWAGRQLLLLTTNGGLLSFHG